MLETHRRSILARILGFFWGPIPWMIEIAGGLSAFARHWEDLTIIVLMLLINAAVGFWEEFKADTAIEALKQRLAPRARVRRDATWKEVDAAELVPGDVVLVRLGNIVPADLELTGDGYLSADQSALTGESLPVTRKAGQSAYSGFGREDRRSTAGSWRPSAGRRRSSSGLTPSRGWASTAS